MQAMENKAVGWYRNSEDRRQHRYWDGSAWDDPDDDDTTATANDLDLPDEPEATTAPRD